MKKLYYFAYGSNVSIKNITSRLGFVKEIGNCTLHHWELVFNYSPGGKTGKFSCANIIPKQGGIVEGVLYELTEIQIAYLNNHEGWPYFYQREHFLVTIDKQQCIAFCYVSRDVRFRSDAIPELSYLNKILDGLYEHNLKRTYNKLVDYKDTNYSLPNGNKHKKL